MTPAPARPDLVATYRLQLHAGFNFGDAAAVVPYLADLGISHLYLSPIQQAVAGSTHGYDQCDPTRISEELGGDSGFRKLSSLARAHGMGIVLDIVPNHMATDEANPWWWELLRQGRGGRTGLYFDVDWEPPDPALRDRVMVPVLAAPMVEVLARRELSLAARGDEVVLAYNGLHFPLADPSAAAPGATVTAELLGRQHYELVPWRDAAQSLNYRRFFDINSLIALREEDPAVFVTVHALPVQLIEEGEIDGIRVDHVDGLRDPAGYLGRLRGRVPEAWLLVEKILEPGEQLPPAWPVDGTTGYDFIQRLQGVFMDPAGERELTDFYAGFTGERRPFHDVATDTKLEVAPRLFAPDLARLERLLAAVSPTAAGYAGDVRTAVISTVAAHLPVYRTYLGPGSPLPETQRARVAAAIDAALGADPGLPRDLVMIVCAALLGEIDGAQALEFAVRFQQFSGPLTAKGVEDTAFYRYNRLVSLNEVGCDPGAFAVSVVDFHTANSAAAAAWPRTMLASSTHDTKRSEDVRARLSLLAQVPEQWAAAVRQWSALADRHRQRGMPDRETEYLLYQVLVGAWPLDEDRALTYMEKAIREAKRQTSWTDADPAYERAAREFVSGLMSDPEFEVALAAFVESLVDAGREVSLAQALVKLTAPGVPDIYQGTELWDLSLVDPDNRRPVDYALRRELLARQVAASEERPVDDQLIRGRWDEGLAKLHVTARALATRRAWPAAFAPGATYTPVGVEGAAGEHAIAYARGCAEDPFMVIVVVPRLTLRSAPDFSQATIRLPDGRWSEVLGSDLDPLGADVTLADLFGRFPLALLERTS